MSNGKIFKKITTDDVYKEIQEIKESLRLYHEEMNTKTERLNGKLIVVNYTIGGFCIGIGIIFTMLVAHLFGIGL